jgi:glutamyl-Q tRNA(Asp) synthetase
MTKPLTNYRGRFAPSPTGPLHKGSLVAAVASYLEAKKHNGQWLIRMEDVDESRNVKGAADEILRSLEAFGFAWDEEVIYQTQRKQAYTDALQQLKDLKLIYPCTCSRKDLKTLADSGQLKTSPMGYIYPGTCINKSFEAITAKNYSIRIKTAASTIFFEDSLQGNYSQQLNIDSGDFIIQRRDGLFAYQLAVVVDDAFQDITHVVRGIDLIDSTPRQIYLQQCLNLPSLKYTHLPVILNSQGEKLSKQTGAEGIGTSANIPLLLECLDFLGQTPPTELKTESLTTVWEWAIAHWKL